MNSRRSAQLPWTRAAVPLAAVVLACSVSPAQAENWPVYVTASQRVSHDDNLFRTTNNAHSDTLSTTAATLGLDKAYGRQNYNLSLTGSVNRFANNDRLNNNGFDTSGSVSSTVGQDIYLASSFSRTRSLASFDYGGNTATRKNIRDGTSYSFSGRYGLYGAMSIGGAASHSEQEYTSTSGSYPNQESDSYGFDVRYTPRQLLTFGVGLRHSPGRTTYNLDPAAFTRYDYTTKTNNLDLTTDWQVSGLSSLNARLSYTKQQREPSETEDRLLSNDYNGWTGSLSWKYTPRGRLSYSVNASRDTTNNSSVYEGQEQKGTIQVGNQESSDARVTTTLGARVDWEASAKIRVGTSIDFTRLQTTNFVAIGGAFSEVEKTGQLTSYALNASYTPARWLSLSCGVQYYKRTADLYSQAYTATVYNCGASATLNAQN